MKILYTSINETNNNKWVLQNLRINKLIELELSTTDTDINAADSKESACKQNDLSVKQNGPIRGTRLYFTTVPDI